jgi:AAA15 family ATPase/GTPase
MLIQFTVGNFKSFKDKATLSLEATHDDWREEDNVTKVPDERLVKAAAIYGENAGGKSNFLMAMMLFRDLIQESSKDSQKGEPIHVTPFRLHITTEGAPSYFEAVFLQKGTRYRYGFEATQKAIVSEWLFRQADSIRETCLFTREQDSINPTDAFKEGKGLESRTRANALFLSVAAQFNGEIAGEVMNWMDQFRNISGLDDAAYMNFTADLLNSSEYGPLIREFVKQVIGIEDLKRHEIARDRIKDLLPKDIPQPVREIVLSDAVRAFTVKTIHQRFDAENKPAGKVEFDLKTDESAGSQKLVALTGPFLHTLREGSVLFVDELEARLHPLLTKALVGLFNSSANRKKAQLIFATHDEGLLDPQRIRRDQIWFVEKDGIGASRLFCLDEIKGVRKEAKFAKEYLLGQFGGVPRLGDLQGVLDNAGK